MRLPSPECCELLTDLLSRGLTCEIRMRGRSMHPAIRDGDLVMLRPLDDQDLRPGDILLCASPEGRLFCHRLVRVIKQGGQRWVQTWGDAVPWPDRPIPLANVLGRVEAVRVRGRELSREALVRGFRRSLRRRRLGLHVPGLLAARRALLLRRCAPAQAPQSASEQAPGRTHGSRTARSRHHSSRTA